MSKAVLVGTTATTVFVLDQLTKWWVHASFELYESRPVIEGLFHLTYVRNPGGAFGILRGLDDTVRIPLFVTFASIAVGVLLYFVRQIPAQQRFLQFALGLVLGGALGNLFDRVAYGEVIDFLDVFWRTYHWPAFNIADSGISCGVAVLLYYTLFVPDPPAEESAG